ncbi:polysaccharide deacetylase family protein [Streptomyces sp. J2-1]|uniref:polysaccharide deacetylase family protein n=1 Tax=Streptomyces corallincola TaxID=2851888 RepID=UPI001C394E96|nr:polysaccharide deacetylase family protein [Streptomyces corallincola]MBV2354016.1 polysaccharide deacetylase family protein [Streptomyces corallincola]
MPHSTPVRRTATAAGLLAPAVLAAAHIGTAATWLPDVRRTLFPGLAGRGRPDHVALTFDDGPDPESTPRFLDQLDELDVRATFFLLGESVARHPELAAELVRRGHEAAVHGWNHSRPWRPAPLRDITEVTRAARVIHEATGGPAPRWYRPPYGILSSGRWLAARRAGLRTVLWSAWGREWDPDSNPDTVRALIGADLRGGGTVLLHDSDHTSPPGTWRAALGAVPALVRDCRAAGLTVGPLGEHGVRGPGSGRGRGQDHGAPEDPEDMVRDHMARDHMAPGPM